MDKAAQKPLPLLAKGMVFASQDVVAKEGYFNRELLSSNDIWVWSQLLMAVDWYQVLWFLFTGPK